MLRSVTPPSNFSKVSTPSVANQRQGFDLKGEWSSVRNLLSNIEDTMILNNGFYPKDPSWLNQTQSSLQQAQLKIRFYMQCLSNPAFINSTRNGEEDILPQHLASFQDNASLTQESRDEIANAWGALKALIHEVEERRDRFTHNKLTFNAENLWERWEPLLIDVKRELSRLDS